MKHYVDRSMFGVIRMINKIQLGNDCKENGKATEGSCPWAFVIHRYVFNY